MSAQPPRVNWSAARAYYLALDSRRRTFAEVARRFKVSDVTVGQRAKREGWVDVAAEVDRRTEQRALTMLVRQRSERLARTLEVYDRANDLVLEMLPLDGAGNVDPAKVKGQLPRLDQILEKLPGLFRIAELAVGEATDRIAIADVQPVIVAIARIAILRAPPEERGEVLRDIEAATAGLVTIEPAAA